VATPLEVEAAEAHLGSPLPPSYRRTLLAGDAALPGQHGLALLPVSEIDRFAVREPEWLDAWLTGFATGGGLGEPDGLADPSFADLVAALAHE
jgi:hypothetical protein